MKTAICFSGKLRSFENVKVNLKQHFDEYIKEYDVFAYLSKENDIHENIFQDIFLNSIVKICEDEIIDVSEIPQPNFLKMGTQAYAQQIYGWYKVNEMRKNKEREDDIKYDFIIRCRTDFKFLNNLPNIEDLKNDRLYIPNFHDFGGYNDRFCIGPNELINNYMDIYEIFQKDQSSCVHAETFLKHCLDLKNTNVELIDIKFNRVLSNGEEIKDCN